MFGPTMLGVIVAMAMCAGMVCAEAQLFGGNATLVAEWNSLNFTWRSSEEYQAWLAADGPASCMPAGVKVDAYGQIYVSVPRWKGTVPSTLNKLVAGETPGSYVLQPYPTWEMNAVGDPNAFQSVLGFEIDASQQVMYVLDQGKVNGKPAIPGSIKFLALDLNSGEVLWKLLFTPELADPAHSFLNDVVYDRANNFFYITDTGLPAIGATDVQGGLLVVDGSSMTARRLLSSTPPFVQPNATLWIHINGEGVLNSAPMLAGADGIGLTPDFETLYYCPLTAHTAYQIPTALLRNPQVTNAQLEAASVPIAKGSASDGLAVDNAGNFYATSLEGSGIHVVQGNSDVSVLIADSEEMVWPDTIGFDHKGSLLFVSNQLHKFMQNELNYSDPSDINFRIWSYYTGTNSYLDK